MRRRGNRSLEVDGEREGSEVRWTFSGTLKLGLNHDPTVLREFHWEVKLVWHQRKVPQRWRDAVINVLHKEDRTECRNYSGISLAARAGAVLLKILASRFSAYCEAKRQLPEEQCGFRPHSSTTDMILRVRRLQQLERKARMFRCSCVSLSTVRFFRRYTPASEYRRR